MPPKISLTKRVQEKFGIKGTLRDYQLRAAKFGVELPHFGLLMDPRLGKTRIAIAVAGYRRKNDLIKKWVVICPSIAKSVWEKEIRETLDTPHKVLILEGKGEERKLLLKGWKAASGVLSILIMNPEATWRLKEFLYKSNPCMITVDESHRFKNHASKQSSTLHTLGKRAKFRNLLTGTFLSKPTDAFSQYKFLDPDVFGTVWYDRDKDATEDSGFLNKYVRSWGFGGHKPSTYRYLDDLSQKIQSRAFQLTREEAGGFPQELYQDFPFELTSPATKHYREMEEELKTMVQDQEVAAAIILTQSLRLQQITGGFLPLHDPDDDRVTVNHPIGKDRIKALKELLEEYPQEEPLVIVAKFRYEISAVSDLLESLGRIPTRIVGGMRPQDRERAKLDFMEGRAQSMVIQQRAGIAIDLSRASTLIFYTYTHSRIDYEQAKARVIARTGGKVSILHLIAQGTVDEDILESIRTNSDLAKSILKKYLR